MILVDGAVFLVSVVSAKQNGLTGGEPEVNGGLNVSSSGELQWNFYTNNPEIKNNPTTWSDAGGIQRNKFHHIVVKMTVMLLL